MGGGVAGGLGGALIGSVVPGVGTALGATLGGLAGSGVQNLVGGGGGASTQPAAQPVSTAQGQFQSYTPQAQQTMDYQFQGLQNQLGNLAWSGLGSLPGGVTPTTALYPQISGIEQGVAAPGQLQGSYGPYGDIALGKALWGLGTEQNIGGGLQNLVTYGQQLGAAGQQALPQIMQAAFNPQIGQAVQNIIANPYYGQQIAGAQQGAQIGGQAAGLVPGQVALLNQLGGQLPGLGAQTAATTTAQVPWLQQLAGQQAGYGADLASQAQGLVPQYQNLYAQTVPGLLQAAPEFAQAAQATTPQLQQIGQTGAWLGAQAPGYAGAMLGTVPQAQQIGALGQGLAGTAPGLGQQAQATTPGLQQIGATGGALAGAAPGFAQGALGTSAGLANAQQQILQAGLDPQGALFNQLSQQTRDQANAIAAQSGLAGTPYAAGLENDAIRNLNIQWQNQQLQRQATADQAAAGLAGQQLAGVTGAGGLLQGLTTAGGQLGLNAAQQQLANTQAQANILNQLTQGGANIGLAGLGAQQAGIQGGANILGGLTQQGANIGLGAAQQQLANTQAGGQLYGNLVGQAGQLGGNLVGGQLNALTGAGGLFNQGAQGAGALAGQAGTLANMGLQQQIAAAQGAQGLFQGGLNLGQGGAQLAQQAGAMPAQTYQQQQTQALNALQMQNQMAGAGVTNLANLTQQLGAAGQQPITGIEAAMRIAQQPYNIARQQAANAQAVLTEQQQFANPLLQMPQDVQTNALRYLTLGENAAGLAGNLGQQAFNQNQAQLQGLGTLGLLGANALGGGGGGGFLGTNIANPLGGNTGLLNTLLGQNFQGTGMTASDVASLSADPNLALAAFNAAGGVPL